MPDEPVPTVEKEYEVVGPRRVYEHAPGEKFKASIHPKLEQLLLDGGHLKVVEPKAGGGRKEEASG